MSPTPAATSTVLRYLTRFRCLAERCEDSCCHGLSVPVSQAHLQRLHSILGPQDSTLRDSVALNPGGAPEEYALLQMRPDGYCPFLDTTRLCSLQRRHGEPALPDTCSNFPRLVTRSGEHLHVSGTLACPEAARLALLHEDALEPVPLPSDLVPRPEAALHLPERSAEAQGLDSFLRDCALRLLQRREYPLPSRLAFLARWAFNLECTLPTVLQSTGPAEALALLQEEQQRFESAPHLQALHQEFAALALPGGHSLGLYASVLRARLGAGRGPRLESWLQGVLASLGLGAQEEHAPEPLQRAWLTLTARREQLEQAHGERVHQYFLHAASNHLWREPLPAPPGLLAATFRLLLRLGLWRVALLGHPQAAALCAPGHQPPPNAQALLDAAAVESFQLTAKHLERSPELLTLAQALARAEPQELLGRALVLASFFRAA